MSNVRSAEQMKAWPLSAVVGNNHTFKLDILNPMGSKDATRPEDTEPGFI